MCDEEWSELMGYARSAALTYYEPTTIVAAHQRERYGCSPSELRWTEDGATVSSGRASLWSRARFKDSRVSSSV